MKLSLVSVFVFVCLGFSNAQTTQPQTSLLWQVSGNGLQKPSYLFGTFHIICRDAFSITPTLREKFNSTNLLFEEMKMDDPNLQMQMMLKLKSDKSLKDILDSTTYQQLNDTFKKITGSSIGFFNNYEPFILTSMLTQKMIPCKNPLQPENEFIKLAKEQKISVEGLETIDDEINAIKKIAPAKQIEGVKQILKNFDSTKIVMGNFMKLYASRNLDSLYAFMQSSDMGADFETALLDERNKKWLPVIVTNLKKQPTFFAFGAGHLGGDNGIINLLRKEGYTVEPLNY